jgi:hypothetical protein
VLDKIMPKVDVPTGKSGDVEITRKWVSGTPNYRIRDGRYVPEGEYTFMHINGCLVMSDTPDERRDHLSAYNHAEGDCLVAGLGLGMIVNAMLLKPEVDTVTVVEINQDVIDLVFPWLKEKYRDKVRVYCDDIMEIRPSKKFNGYEGGWYDCIWSDIWNDLCTDNLEEMHTLHRRWGKSGNWKGSWVKSIYRIRCAEESIIMELFETCTC